MSTFQLLNGLTFAALLFVVASGFTLIFGLLRIVNLAHGAFYAVGRGGTILNSTDAVHWTALNSETPLASGLLAVGT